jgi:NAD(P) transhydrogenase subunit beta
MNNALITGIELSYLLAAILFIIGLKQLSSPLPPVKAIFWLPLGC